MQPFKCFKCGKIVSDQEVIYLHKSIFGILESQRYYCEKCILEYNKPQSEKMKDTLY